MRRLEELGEQLDGGNMASGSRGRTAADLRHAADPRVQGVEHFVTVRDDDFEWQGRPYKSLSAIARAITGTGGTAGLLWAQNRRRA